MIQDLIKKFLKHLVIILLLGYPLYIALTEFESLNPIARELDKKVELDMEKLSKKIFK